jgi:hypothetical protein
VYPNARAIILGQLSVVVFALMMAGLVGLAKGRYALAGLGFAMATIKPQMVFLVIPWLLWWTAWARRWTFWAGFMGGLSLLIGAGWLVQPGWIGEFLAQIRTYTTYTEFGSLIWIMTTYALATPVWVEWVLTSAVIAFVGWVWWRFRRASTSAFLWTTCLTLVATHFVAPRTATTHFSPLVLALFLLFALWQTDDAQRARWMVGVGLGLTWLGTWALFAATLAGRQESAWNYLPIPILLGVWLIQRRSDLLSLPSSARFA